VGGEELEHGGSGEMNKGFHLRKVISNKDPLCALLNF
jgi:hypothetical protein